MGPCIYFKLAVDENVCFFRGVSIKKTIITVQQKKNLCHFATLHFFHKSNNQGLL